MNISDFKKNLKKNLFPLIVLVLAVIVFITSGVIIISRFIPQKNNYQRYINNSSSNRSKTGSDIEQDLPDNPVDFSALKAVNPDVCGWIRIEGTANDGSTVIDYPILRSGPDKPEDFYLDHDLEGNKKGAGSIYIQRLNSTDLSDANNVIYGHNMLNGSMFATLRKYRDAEFFNTHKDVYIYTEGHIYRYEIFSAFVYDDRHILNSYNFYIAQGYQAFLDMCLNPQSLVKNVDTKADVTIYDRIITLSTCTSKNKERYLVIAKLVEDTYTK